MIYLRLSQVKKARKRKTAKKRKKEEDWKEKGKKERETEGGDFNTLILENCTKQKQKATTT